MSVNPSRRSTRTISPTSAPASQRASQSSPLMRTCPSGRHRVTTAACAPIIASAPVVGRHLRASRKPQVSSPASIARPPRITSRFHGHGKKRSASTIATVRATECSESRFASDPDRSARHLEQFRGYGFVCWPLTAARVRKERRAEPTISLNEKGGSIETTHPSHSGPRRFRRRDRRPERTRTWRVSTEDALGCDAAVGRPRGALPGRHLERRARGLRRAAAEQRATCRCKASGTC